MTSEAPLLRFIPFRRSDIADMCLRLAGLDDAARAQFDAARARIETHFRDEFSALRQAAKARYAPHDPDADTLTVDLGTGDAGDLTPLLEELLDRANYERVSEAELEAAFKSSSLFSIRLHVDTSDFAEVLLYTRGVTAQEEQVPLIWGLFPRPVSFLNYERVVLFLKFRDDIDVRPPWVDAGPAPPCSSCSRMCLPPTSRCSFPIRESV